MADTKTITLIHQNDTHAHMEAHWELRWRDGQPETWRAGGYAHMRAVADSIRTDSDGACIHVDSGDAIHGTGPAAWTSGAVTVPPLNALGLDLFTPGNWEWGYGPQVLRDRVTEFTFPVIAGNVQNAETGALEFPPTWTRDVGALRAGFVGITSPIVTRAMPRAFGAGLRFTEATDILPGIVARLREEEQPDLVVLVSHYGFAQEVAIARRVDGIDVILGGHTHDVLTEAVTVGRTIITQSGAHGSYVTRLDLDVAHGKVCAFRHQLIPVVGNGDTASEDQTVASVVADSLRPHRRQLDEIVGETSVLLHRGTVLESPMDNLITAAYRESTGADVAFSHGWRYGTPIPPGPITAGELWQMIPTNPEVFTISLTGAAIRRMIERSIERTFSGDPLAQQGGYVIRFAGMTVVARINNPPGHRIHRIDIGGKLLDPTRDYTVAAAGEQSVERREGRAGTGVKAIDSLRSYLAKNRPSHKSATQPALVAI